MYRLNKDVLIVSGCLITAIVVIIIGALVLHNVTTKDEMHIEIPALSTSNIYTKQPSYTNYTTTDSFYTVESFNTGNSSASNIEDFTAYNTEATFTVKSASVNASGANMRLYEIADANFICYFGNQRINPIFPLALANVETPGRADHSITWSALFPSKIVTIDLLETMDVTTVVSNQSYFKALSAECSTRDRGALQMSPTYGTNNAEINKLMSGTEKDKLSQVDTSDYKVWANGASSSSGDRFNVRDVCLRLSSSMQQGVSFMLKNNYIPKTDMQLVAMCAMHHHSSGVWYYNDKNRHVGKWKSVTKAYEWSELVSSDAMLKALSDYAYNNPDVYSIDGNKALQIFSTVYDNTTTEFASSSLVCTYPIKVLYAYIKLCIMYTS